MEFTKKGKNLVHPLAEERKKSWTELPEPKPDWETFKRMLPVFNFNALAVHRSWTAKQQKKI